MAHWQDEYHTRVLIAVGHPPKILYMLLHTLLLSIQATPMLSRLKISTPVQRLFPLLRVFLLSSAAVKPKARGEMHKVLRGEIVY